jgi:hypothetical protein
MSAESYQVEGDPGSLNSGSFTSLHQEPLSGPFTGLQITHEGPHSFKGPLSVEQPMSGPFTNLQTANDGPHSLKGPHSLEPLSGPFTELQTQQAAEAVQSLSLSGFFTELQMAQVLRSLNEGPLSGSFTELQVQQAEKLVQSLSLSGSFTGLTMAQATEVLRSLGYLSGSSSEPQMAQATELLRSLSSLELMSGSFTGLEMTPTAEDPSKKTSLGRAGSLTAKDLSSDGNQGKHYFYSINASALCPTAMHAFPFIVD